MAVFLLRYVVLFGSLNVYLCWKVAQAWPQAPAANLAVALFCTTMVGIAIFVRLFERGRLFQITRRLSVATHTWLVLLLWFCLLVAPVDAWNIGVRLLRTPPPEALRLCVPMAPALIAGGVLIGLAFFWALREASRVRLKTVTVPCLAPGAAPIRVVQISDLHIGITMSAAKFRRIVARIRDAQPDLLVNTGDLLDLSFDRASRPQDLLADLRPPLGKFAVFGNHEYYRLTRESVTFLREAGFRLLREESVLLDDRLCVAGVDDPIGRRMKRRCMSREESVLPAKKRCTTLLLKHRPLVRAESLGRFDLQLSGHTHGGQVFPLHLAMRLRHPYGPGLHRLGQGSALYVNRGAGTWGPPLRLFARPEIAVLLLTPALPVSERHDRDVVEAPAPVTARRLPELSPAGCSPSASAERE